MDVVEYQHYLMCSHIFFFYFQNLSKQVMSEVKILKALKHVSLLLKKTLAAYTAYKALHGYKTSGFLLSGKSQ